jgi:hypothetical protein
LAGAGSSSSRDDYKAIPSLVNSPVLASCRRNCEINPASKRDKPCTSAPPLVLLRSIRLISRSGRRARTHPLYLLHSVLLVVFVTYLEIRLVSSRRFITEIVSPFAGLIPNWMLIYKLRRGGRLVPLLNAIVRHRSRALGRKGLFLPPPALGRHVPSADQIRTICFSGWLHLIMICPGSCPLWEKRAITLVANLECLHPGCVLHVPNYLLFQSRLFDCARTFPATADALLSLNTRICLLRFII